MASLDLGALSYTLKLNREGFSEGINQTKNDLKNLGSDVKTADEANKTFQANIRNFQSSLQATGVSFENLDQKLRLWVASNKESIGSIEANSQAIETNKAKMAELDLQLSKTDTILKETKTVFGENSVEYKNVENNVIELELKYRSLEEETKRLEVTNKEMEASANPSFFEKLKSNVSSVSSATENLGKKGISVSGILKNAFGSIKNVVMSTAIPIMAGMGLQSLIDKAKAGQQAVGQMNAVLTSTHGVAGMTKEALINLAQSQSQVTTYSKGANIATENLLLTFTNISSKTFPDALKAVNDMSTALGQDTKSSAIQLGKALNDPISGITALSRVGVSFTEQQKKQIQTMIQAKDVAGAQKIILQELSKEFGGSAVAAGKSFDGQLTIIKNQLFGLGAGVTSQLMPSVTNLLTMLNSHMPQIQSVANNVISGISTSFKTLGPILLGIGKDIGKIATEIFPQMNSSGSNLGKTLLDLAKGGLTTVKEVFDWLAQHGNVTRAAIIGIGSAFVTLKTVSAATSIFKAFTDGASGVKTATGLISNFGKAFTTIKSGEGVVKGISTAFGMANPTILIAVGVITAVAVAATLIITHWTPIKNFFINLWTGVKQKFTEFWNWLKSFMGTWGTAILALVMPVIGIPALIIQHWGQIKNFFINLFEEVKSGVLNGLNGIKSIFTTVITVISNFVSSKFGGVVDGVKSIFSGFKEYFTGIWNLIKNIFVGAILLILDLVTGNFGKLKSDAEGIFNNLKNSVAQIWNGIKEIFTGVLSTIKAYFETIWNGIGSFLSGIWNSIKSVAISAWSNLKIGVINIVEGLETAIKNTWNAIISFFENLPGRLFSLGVLIFTKLKDGAWSILSTLGSLIEKGFTSGINFITSLPAKAVEWGKDFIQGLINGIKGMVGAVGDAVKGVAKKMRDFLHFSVPDEGPLSDADTYGSDFMQLLADTIDQNSDKPAEAAQKVAQLVSDKIQSIKDSLKKDVGSLNSELDKLSVDEGTALRGKKGAEYYSILDEYEDKKNAIKAEIDLRNDQADKEIAEIQRVGKMNKEELQQELQDRKDLASSVNNLNSEIVEALKEKYSEEEKTQEDVLNNELDNLDKWKEQSEKNIEDVSNAKIAALQAESDALDEQQKAEERQEDNQNDLDNISKLKDSIKYEHDDYNKAQLQKQLDRAQADYNKKLAQQAVEDKKAELQNQINAIKDNADSQKKTIENIYNTQKTYLQKQLDDLKAFYDTKTSDAALQAEAEKMIMQNNQKDIVTLLNSYGDQYKQAGQTLGERLADGFQPAIDNIKSMIDSITQQISAARDSALDAMQTANAAMQVSSFSSTSVPGDTTNNNNKTVVNNVNITSPVAQTPSEQRTAMETTLRKLAFTT